VTGCSCCVAAQHPLRTNQTAIRSDTDRIHSPLFTPEIPTVKLESRPVPLMPFRSDGLWAHQVSYAEKQRRFFVPYGTENLLGHESAAAVSELLLLLVKMTGLLASARGEGCRIAQDLPLILEGRTGHFPETTREWRLTL
jgi:hypothetical protein